MQYVWQHGLWPPGPLTTVDGRPVSVIDRGRLNTGSGPDFFNAKIRIGGRLWAGDVEIHVRASDWHRHGHDGNRAYDTVILHVVGRDDAQIRRHDGEVIPQLLMPCSPSLRDKYATLAGRADADMPCAAEIAATPPLHISDWLSALLMERLYAKSDRIAELLQRTADDWERVCFVTVARALGFGINAEPMERMALAVPMSALNKHSDSREAIEALLFGTAGMLDGIDLTDSYAAALTSEFRFLAAKFDIKPGRFMGWKTSRMRPGNMPHRRIALLASLCHGGFRMLADILRVQSVQDARDLFDTGLSDYWMSHYTLGGAAAKPGETLPARLSRNSIDTLVINVVAPLIMAHELSLGNIAATERAVALLEGLPPESNSVTQLMRRAGLRIGDAADSQAAIQLRRAYCEQRKCLYCRIGRRMLGRWASARV